MLINAKIRKIFLSVIILMPTSTKICAQSTWELGAGLSGLYMPHYLGADQANAYALPFPYFIYQSDRLNVDRAGVKGDLLQGNKWRLVMGSGLHLPVDSNDNKARKSMDDLEPLFEIGPKLEYEFYKSSAAKLELIVPLQAALSIENFNLDAHGWTLSPYLSYTHFYDHLKWAHFKWTTSVGPVMSDRKYHGYFYDVGLQDVTSDRPFYDADGGYTATRLTTSVNATMEKYRFGVFIGYYDLGGAKNHASPLLKQDNFLSGGFYFAWLFKTSKAKTSKEN